MTSDPTSVPAKPDDLCLVAGGTGFLGSPLVEELMRDGVRVAVLSRSGIPSNANLHRDVVDVRGDMRDPQIVEEALRGAAQLIIFANSMLPAESFDAPTEDISQNLCGVVNLLYRAGLASVRKVVLASSGGTIYGSPSTVPIREDHYLQPICSYGIVKLASERYLSMFSRRFGFKAVALRYGNPYGANQKTSRRFGLIATVLARLKARKEIEIWGDGTIVRDYIYIDDAVSATLAALRYAGDKEVFNVGSGTGTTILDVIRIAEEVSGIKARINFKLARPVDVDSIVLDIALARNELRWAPKWTLEAGIRETWHRIRGNGGENG